MPRGSRDADDRISPPGNPADPWSPLDGRCNARKATGDGLCRQNAGQRTSHQGIGECSLHTGATPAGVARAERMLAERAVETYGLPRDVDPAVALLEEVARTAGHIDWLTQMIRSLDPAALVQGVREIRAKTGPAGADGQRVEIERVQTVAHIPTVWLDLYYRERRHLVAVCRDTLAAGVQERTLRLAEEAGSIICNVLRGALDDLGMTGHDQVDEVVSARLGALRWN